MNWANAFAKITVVMALVMASGCSTPAPVRTYEHNDASAVIIRSFDSSWASLKTDSEFGPQRRINQLLDLIKDLPVHKTAVVILENYTEPQPNEQFRDRGTPWFIALRALGYEHIVFLRGQNVPNPDGLVVLANYD